MGQCKGATGCLCVCGSWSAGDVTRLSFQLFTVTETVPCPSSSAGPNVRTHTSSAWAARISLVSSNLAASSSVPKRRDACQNGSRISSFYVGARSHSLVESSSLRFIEELLTFSFFCVLACAVFCRVQLTTTSNELLISSTDSRTDCGHVPTETYTVLPDSKRPQHSLFNLFFSAPGSFDIRRSPSQAMSSAH